MAKYTNIETARALICDLCDCLYPDACCSNKCDWMEELEEDAVDVAPVVNGKWIHLGGDEWCCSACGFVITTEGSWDKPTKKYCEDCGTRMDGGTDPIMHCSSEEALAKIVMSINNRSKAEQCLIDNGIEPDEAPVVLQALGYILFDEELYPEE